MNIIEGTLLKDYKDIQKGEMVSASLLGEAMLIGASQSQDEPWRTSRIMAAKMLQQDNQDIIIEIHTRNSVIEIALPYRKKEEALSFIRKINENIRLAMELRNACGFTA